MGTSYYTVCDEVEVQASESCRFNGRDLGPSVEVSFPDREWDRTIYTKAYPSLDAAKDAAKSLAGTLKSLAPKGVTGFFAGARRNQDKPAHVEAREAIESAVQEWAGEDALVVSVND